MGTYRILVVEDEEPFAAVLQGFLERLGHEVVGIANSGEAALELVKQHRPDLALMDVEIRGGMDGFETVKVIREIQDIPIVFLTGLADDATLERVKRSGSFGYLSKPFRLEELKASLDLALSRHGDKKELKEREQIFAAAIKCTDDAVVLADEKGVITFLNPAAERLIGCPVSRAVNQPLSAIIRLSDVADGLDGIFRAAARGAFIHESQLLTAAGSELPVEICASIVRDEVGSAMGTVLVFRDVTARKQQEAALRRSQAELRSLAGHLEAAREDERARIAREIHDEFGQLLTGFKFDLAWLEKKLAVPETPRPVMLDKVKGVTTLLGEMMQSVRRISTELRPGVLDDLGLVAAVEWQAKEFESRTGIKTQVVANIPDQPLPQELATALFRVLQESLTNVARHAEAKSVRVKLFEEESRIILQVRDDGRGISDAELAKTGVFGLMGMRERIIPLRGQCEIRGAPGNGTTVFIAVPLEPRERA